MTIPTDTQFVDRETIVKFCSYEFYIIITSNALIYPKGGAGTTNLLVGMTRNVVRVNIG